MKTAKWWLSSCLLIVLVLGALMWVSKGGSASRRVAGETYEQSLKEVFAALRIKRSTSDEKLLLKGIESANLILSQNSPFVLRYEDGKSWGTSAASSNTQVHVVLASGERVSDNEMQVLPGVPSPTVLVNDYVLNLIVGQREELDATLKDQEKMKAGLVALELLHEVGHIAIKAKSTDVAEARKVVDTWRQEKFIDSTRAASIETLADAYAIKCLAAGLRSPAKDSGVIEKPVAAGLSLHMIDRLRNIYSTVRLSGGSPDDVDKREKGTPSYLPMELRMLLAEYQLDPSAFNAQQVQDFLVFEKTGVRNHGKLTIKRLTRPTGGREILDVYFMGKLCGSSIEETKVAKRGTQDVVVTTSISDFTINALGRSKTEATVISTVDGTPISMRYDSDSFFNGKKKVVMEIRDGIATATVIVPGKKPAQMPALKAPPALLAGNIVSADVLNKNGGHVSQFVPDMMNFVDFHFVEGGYRKAIFGKRTVREHRLVATSPIGTMMVYIGPDDDVYEIEAPMIRFVNHKVGLPTRAQDEVAASAPR